MKCFIYKIVNKINGKFYIGSTINLEKRKNRHLNSLRNNIHHCFHLQKAYNKYGEDAFYFTQKEVEAETEKDLRILEERYIGFCWNSGLLYNVSKKGCGGDLISYHPKNDEFRLLQSKIQKERYSNMTYEEKKQISERVSGDKNPNYDNRWDDEQREKASIRLKKFYKEHEIYIKGKTFEEYYGEERAKEIKQKISENAKKRIGEKNPFFGKTHSEETKKKISSIKKGKPNISCAKKVLYNGKLYESVSDCSRQLNIPMLTISYRCRKQIYGFSYAEDEQNPNNSAKHFYTFEECEEVASHYKTKKDLMNGDNKVYNWLLRNKKMDDVAKKYFKEIRHKWTKEEIIEIAKKYNSYSDFLKNENKAVSAIRWNKWTEEIKNIWK